MMISKAHSKSASSSKSPSSLSVYPCICFTTASSVDTAGAVFVILWSASFSPSGLRMLFFGSRRILPITILEPQICVSSSLIFAHCFGTSIFRQRSIVLAWKDICNAPNTCHYQTMIERSVQLRRLHPTGDRSTHSLALRLSKGVRASDARHLLSLYDYVVLPVLCCRRCVSCLVCFLLSTIRFYTTIFLGLFVLKVHQLYSTEFNVMTRLSSTIAQYVKRYSPVKAYQISTGIMCCHAILLSQHRGKTKNADNFIFASSIRVA